MDGDLYHASRRPENGVLPVSYTHLKLREALENAQKAQETYGERVDTARANIQRCEEALAALGDETGDTSEEQARLTAELEGYNRELSEAQSYQEAATRAVNSWQTQVNTCLLYTSRCV